MKKYSILIVGIKCYYGHIREFVINLKKKNPLVEITLLTSMIPEEVRNELLGYVNKSVIVSTYNNSHLPKFFVQYINILLTYLYFLWLHISNKFDIVNIHFAKRSIKYFIPIIKRMSDNIVISPWGSDVLRVEGERTIKDLQQIYSKAKYVTVGRDSQIGQCIIEKFKVDPSKMIKLSWGGELFDIIRNNTIDITNEDAKKRFGLTGRYVITCGYNIQKEQRHEEIIDAINSIKEQLPNNLTLLFPFTYGYKTKSRAQYVNFLIEKCKGYGMESVVIEDNLSLEDLLKLRKATDIFVHVQPTDAGSRSVMEYVACNKKVVHGAWIKYDYLEDNKPSCYFPVDDMGHLGACILKAHKAHLDELPVEVEKVIWERGWDYKISLWNDFFESIAP